jgi:PBSX family phage terminase large subunit
MPLNKAQTAVASSEARFRVFVAGRRTGKTFLSVRELARYARHPNRKILYICPTYQMGRDIIWADLKNRLGKLNWIARTNESRLELTLVNDSVISIRSGDNPDALRGGGYDFVVFDETSDLKQELWTEVIRPALSAQKPVGSALFCGTPKGMNWFKDLYDLGKGDDPDWASYQYTTLEGGNVPEAEIQAAKRDLDERTFRQEYEAKFETYSGIIAYNFSEDNIVSLDIPNPAKQLIIGMDFNNSPMTAVIMIRTPTGLHAFDEIRMMGSNTDEMVDEIKTRYPHARITVFPDNSGIQRKTSAGGRTDVSILQNAGFVVKLKPRNPPVRDRINAVNSLLKNAEGERRFTVDRKCKYLIQSLQRYTYKPDTQTPDKSTGYDHMFDAATYAVEYLYPVTREVKPDNTNTFGVW